MHGTIVALPAARRNSATRVLQLLQENTSTALQLVEALMGHPIKRCPPARSTCRSDADLLNHLRSHLPIEHNRRAPEGWERVHVERVLQRPGRAYSKNFALCRPGVSLAQLVREGCPPRSIRRARAEGWLVVEVRA